MKNETRFSLDVCNDMCSVINELLEYSSPITTESFSVFNICESRKEDFNEFLKSINCEQYKDVTDINLFKLLNILVHKIDPNRNLYQSFDDTTKEINAVFHVANEHIDH